MSLRVLGVLAAALPLVAQDYKAAPTGGPPAEIAQEVRRVLEGRGTRITGPYRLVFCEVWLRTGPVAEGVSVGEAIRSGSAPKGALMGVIRYASPGADREGRGFGPGLYTLRHAGGDGVVMARVEDDRGLEPPEFEELEALSRKVTRTEATASLRLRTAAPGASPRLRIMGDGEWILHLAVDQEPVALLIVGVAK